MKKHQKGFTLMELMVVIVIVAILAAVAVPLYINYVKDAQLTEAKGAIGAIISAEQAYYQKSAQDGDPTYGSYTTGDPACDLKKANLIDVAEAEIRWKFKTLSFDKDGYVVQATYTVGDNPPTVKYTFIRPGGTGVPTAEFDK